MPSSPAQSIYLFISIPGGLCSFFSCKSTSSRAHECPVHPLCTWLYGNVRTDVTEFVARALLYLILVHGSAVLGNDWDVEKKKKALVEPCKHPAQHSQGYLANKKLTAYDLITKAITLHLAVCKRDSKKMQDAFCLTRN